MSNIKEYMKRYREKNKEKLKRRSKLYHLRNRERMNKLNRDNYYKNKERRNKQSAEYYAKNRDKMVEWHKAHYIKNRDKNKLYDRIRSKKYHMINKDKEREYNKKYRLNNKDKIKKRNHSWYLKTKGKFKIQKRKYWFNRYRTNINHRISSVIRSRIRQVLKRNSKSEKTKELIGCSTEELKQHLQKQFTLGMNWKNYGFGWHIDHIRPCASFDLSKSEEQRKCFHFSNLQPLWANENLSKLKK